MSDKGGPVEKHSHGIQRGFALLSRRTDEVRDTRRDVAIQNLFHTKELAAVATNMVRGDSYRVILSQPVRGALNARADGLLDAFVKGNDGKILAVARLERASYALMSSATMLAGHAMLAQISAQIDRLQSSVDQVLAKIDAERLGKVDAALAFLGHAGHYRPEHHTPMLLHAAQTLSEVLAGTLREIEQTIAHVPEPQEWNISRALWDTTGRTAEALDRAESSMRTALMCVTALGQTQLHLNGEDGAAGIMREWLDRALNLPLARAEFLARRLPITAEDDRRDRFWIDTRHALERAMERVEEALEPDRPLVVQFEAHGGQLIDGSDADAGLVTSPEKVAITAPLRVDPLGRRR